MSTVEQPPASGGGRGDSVSRNAVFAFATQLSTALVTALLTAYLVRALGVEGFGVFALAVSIGGLLRRPSDVGTTQSAARFVAEHHGDVKGVTGVLGMALPLRITSATAIGVAMLVLAEPIADLYNTPALAWPLRAIAVSFIGQSVMRFVVVIFTALRRTSAGFWVVTFESGIEMTASVALVALFGGATAAAAGRGVAYVLGALLGLLLLQRMLGRSPLVRTGPSPVARREFLNYSAAMFVVAGAFSAFAAIDVLLLGALEGPTAVGEFSAPMRLITFLGFFGLAVAQAVAPRHASRVDGGKPPVGGLERAIRYVLVVQAALLPVTTVWAAPVIEVALGAGFDQSVAVLQGLAPYLFVTGIAPLLVAPLNYMGEARRRIPIAIAAVLLNTIIDLILIPRLGVMGAVIGCNVGYMVFIGAHVWLAHRLIGVSLKRLAWTAARALAAATAAAGVLLMVGVEALSLADWIVGLALGGVAFMAVILGSRELTPAELRELAGIPRRFLRR